MLDDEDDVLAAFGGEVRRVRERAGISQEKLAELSGLHRTYISSVERGNRNLSLLNVVRLARALDLPPSKLLRTIGS